MQTLSDIRMVAPALEKYAQGPLADLWKRPGLAPRDRSMVTISALIARNQTNVRTSRYKERQSWVARHDAANISLHQGRFRAQN